MSWQTRMCLAGAGVACAALTASCSAPRAAATQAMAVPLAAAATQAAPVHAPPAGSTGSIRGGRATAHSSAAARSARSRARSRAHHRAAGRASAPAAGSSGSAAAAPAATSGPRLGVYETGLPRSYGPVDQFAAAVGHQPGIVLYYSGIGETFRTAFAQQARAHGAVPLVQIEPLAVSMASIAAGRYDAYFRSYARDVRAFGHQVIIGFAHEMNGPWYPWGWTHVSPGTWVQAWRHVVTVFRGQGASNVTWLWTVSRVQNQGPFRSYWPGAGYVSWVGIDGYYSQPQDTFSRVFVRAMNVVRQFTSAPILISESAIGQRAGQARKIPDLLAGVISHRLLGLVWFDVSQRGASTRQDWRLEGHPAALAAFRNAVRPFR